MSSWSQFSKSHGSQPARRPQQVPPTPAPPHQTQGQSSRPGPKAAGKKERSATKLKSGFWTGTRIKFGKDYNFTSGFEMQSDGSHLALVSPDTPNVHNLQHSITLIADPRDGHLEVKENMSTPDEPKRPGVLVVSRSVIVRTSDYTVLKSDNREGENVSSDFFIKVVLKAGGKFKAVNEVLFPAMAGDQANAMFLKAFEDIVPDMKYMEVCIPDYLAKTHPQTGKPEFRESELQKVLHGKEFDDIRSDTHAFCHALRQSIKEGETLEGREKKSLECVSAQVKYINHPKWQRRMIALLPKDIKIKEGMAMAVDLPDGVDGNTMTDQAGSRAYALAGIKCTNWLPAGAGQDTPRMWQGIAGYHNGQPCIDFENSFEKLPADAMTFLHNSAATPCKIRTDLESMGTMRLKKIVDHLEKTMENAEGTYEAIDEDILVDYILPIRPLFLADLDLPTDFPRTDWALTNQYLTKDVLASKYDVRLDSHVNAVFNALDNNCGVALIKGPPATGKTTLLAKLVVIIMQQFNFKGELINCAAETNQAVLVLVNRVVRILKERGVRNLRDHICVVLSDTYLARGVSLESKISPELEECLFDQHIVRTLAKEPQKWDGLRQGRKEIEKFGRVETLALRADYARELNLIAQEIATKVQVVFSTLASANESNKFFRRPGPAVVPSGILIVDEAGQSNKIHLAGALLALNPSRLVLGGDEKQLGPFVGTDCKWSSWVLAESIFAQGIAREYPCTMLDVQWRTAPPTYAGTSAAFYGGKVKSASTTLLREKFCHLLAASYRISFKVGDRKLTSLKGVNHFFDIRGSRVEQKGTSLYNPDEADFFIGLVRAFAHAGIPWDWFMCEAGYNAHRDGLSDRSNEIPGVRIANIDATQGDEHTAVVVPVVAVGHPGFMKALERLNVGTSRGEEMSAVISNKEVMQQAKHWTAYLSQMKLANPNYEITVPGDGPVE